MNFPITGRRASESPITLKAFLAVAGFVVTLLSAAISYATASARTDAKLESKVDAVEYQKDQTALARQLGDMKVSVLQEIGALRTDVQVTRTAVCAKDPEVCKR